VDNVRPQRTIAWGLLLLVAAVAVGWLLFGRAPAASITSNVTLGGPQAASLGQPVPIEGMEVTILEVHYTAGTENQQPAAGYVYVGAKVRVKANADNKFASLTDWSALADGSRQGSVATVQVDAWTPALLIEQLQPGATIEGWLSFEVPQPTSFVRLVYDPNSLASGPTVYVDTSCCK
jgi:hypothetical protein